MRTLLASTLTVLFLASAVGPNTSSAQSSASRWFRGTPRSAGGIRWIGPDACERARHATCHVDEAECEPPPRSSWRCRWFDESRPTDYTRPNVTTLTRHWVDDLNNDGRREVAISVAGTGGAGANELYFLYVTDQNRSRFVGSFFMWVASDIGALSGERHGLRDIHVPTQANCCSNSLQRYEYDGRQYRSVGSRLFESETGRELDPATGQPL